jgi:hypothetical protein
VAQMRSGTAGSPESRAGRDPSADWEADFWRVSERNRRRGLKVLAMLAALAIGGFALPEELRIPIGAPASLVILVGWVMGVLRRRRVSVRT